MVLQVITEHYNDQIRTLTELGYEDEASLKQVRNRAGFLALIGLHAADQEAPRRRRAPQANRARASSRASAVLHRADDCDQGWVQGCDLGDGTSMTNNGTSFKSVRQPQDAQS